MTRRLPPALCAVLALSLGACSSSDAAGTASGGTTPTVRVTSAAPGEETTEPADQDPTPTSSTTTAAEVPSSGTPTATPSVVPAPADDPAPATYDDAVARLDAVGQEPQQLRRFESATGNLYCVIDDDFIAPSCELLEGTIPDPVYCGDGPTTVIGRIELTDGVPRPVCNSDTIREPGAPVLGDAAAATWRGSTVQCLMETVGVTCIDTASAQGFFLATGRYVIFTAGG